MLCKTIHRIVKAYFQIHNQIILAHCTSKLLILEANHQGEFDSHLRQPIWLTGPFYIRGPWHARNWTVGCRQAVHETTPHPVCKKTPLSMELVPGAGKVGGCCSISFLFGPFFFNTGKKKILSSFYLDFSPLPDWLSNLKFLFGAFDFNNLKGIF